MLSTHSLISASNLPTYLLSPRLSKLSKPNAQQLEDTLLSWSTLRSSYLLRGIESFGRQPSTIGGSLAEGVLACSQAEHALLLSLLPPSSPTIPVVLAQTLQPSIELMSTTLVGLAQGLKKEPLPWKAYALYEGLDGVSVQWTAFVRSVGFGGSGGVVKDAFKEVMAGGLKGLCLRSLPEAVEGAKVSRDPRVVGLAHLAIELTCRFVLYDVADRTDAPTRRTSVCCCLRKYHRRQCCVSISHPDRS